MKKIVSVIASFLIAITVLAPVSSAAESEFVMENGLLKDYVGTAEKVVIPNGVVEIGENAFLECTTMRSVVIPPTVTKISPRAFTDCISLRTVEIPGSVKTIDVDAFFGCSSLASATIGEGVKTINDSAFCGCTSLTSVSLPTTLEKLGKLAFCDTDLSNIAIPAKTRSIHAGVFFGCDKLKSIVVDPANARYSSRGGCLLNKAGTTILECPTAPGTFVVDSIIGRVAYTLPAAVKKIVLPSSVKYPSMVFDYNAGSASANIKIYTPKKSYTQRYALKNKLPFKVYTYTELKAPSSFKAKSTKTGIRLTWKKRSGARSYHIWRKAPGGIYVKYATVSKRYTSYTDKRTVKGTKYYYKVCATQRVAGKTTEARMSSAKAAKAR